MAAVSGPRNGAELVSLSEVREAAAGLEGVAVRTPLVEAPELSRFAGQPVYLKLENRQPTGAFKLRGAWTALRRMSPPERGSGVITYSSGNHGQAVAYAAQRLGLRAIVVMPETAPRTKIDGVKRWGGEVIFAGTTSEAREHKARALASSEGLAVIPPFDHRNVIAGQATVGLEIFEDLPEVAHVAVPVGGGGLASGVTAALIALNPTTEIIAVEPEGAAALAAALASGRPVKLDHTHSVADGLLPLSVGELNFMHLAGRVTSVTVTDEAILSATRWLGVHQKLNVEPSGAATTAALRSGAFAVDGPAVLVVSGGNVAPSLTSETRDGKQRDG